MLLDEKMLSTLGKLGLTLYGAKTYYILVALGRLSAADIASETGIPRTKIYETLSRLQNEGWITSERGRPIRFEARHPRDVIEERRQVLNTDVDYLSTELARMYEQEADKELPKVWLIRGMDNIAARTIDMMSRARQSIILLGGLYAPGEIEPIRQCIANAKKRGVSVRIITGKEIRLKDEEIDVVAAFSPLVPDLRIGSPPSFRYVVIDERELLNVYPKIEGDVPDFAEAVAMWVQNPMIASHTVSMFNMIWDGAGTGAFPFKGSGSRHS